MMDVRNLIRTCGHYHPDCIAHGPPVHHFTSLDWLLFARPPNGQLSIGLPHVHHDISKWRGTPHPIGAGLRGWFCPPLAVLAMGGGVLNLAVESIQYLEEGSHTNRVSYRCDLSKESAAGPILFRPAEAARHTRR